MGGLRQIPGLQSCRHAGTYPSYLPACLRSLAGTGEVKYEDYTAELTERVLGTYTMPPGLGGSSPVVMRGMWVCACFHSLPHMGYNYVCGAIVSVRSLNLELDECIHKKRVF